MAARFVRKNARVSQAFSGGRSWLAVAVVTAALLMVGGFAACTKKRIAPPPADSYGALEPLSEELVDVFFDATLSMKGFVSAPTTSSYQMVVPMLERGVIEGWKGGRANFNKFGDDIAPLPGRQYLEASKPAFYADSKYNRKTLIERVVDKAAQDHLTVIVTDLFQTNADINQLSEKLKQKFIANNLSIGIYAIRSQFEGLVYDVGPDAHSFKYTSGKPATERPFYLLAFGKHADISHYFDVLERAETVHELAPESTSQSARKPCRFNWAGVGSLQRLASMTRLFAAPTRLPIFESTQAYRLHEIVNFFRRSAEASREIGCVNSKEINVSSDQCDGEAGG